MLATVGTLLVTALTLRSGQEQLNLAHQGQVTDRYTKATEQLGSSTRDVRTAAVYALERIAEDFPRDRQTIRDVLAAFIREHDPAPAIKTQDLPPEPDTDVAAALTALTRRPPDPENAPRLDLHDTRLPGATLHIHALSFHASGYDLPRPNLRDADLRDADLRDADLRGADLREAELAGADLREASLDEADLRGADLRKAKLTSADLTGADLRSAYLNDADLRGAILYEADLTDADLRGTKGM